MIPEEESSVSPLFALVIRQRALKACLDWSTKLAAANDKKQIWHEAKLRGRGYANASSILEYVRKSVGIKDGADAGRQAVKWFVSRIIELDEQLSDIENQDRKSVV